MAAASEFRFRFGPRIIAPGADECRVPDWLPVARPRGHKSDRPRSPDRLLHTYTRAGNISRGAPKGRKKKEKEEKATGHKITEGEDVHGEQRLTQRWVGTDQGKTSNAPRQNRYIGFWSRRGAARGCGPERDRDVGQVGLWGGCGRGEIIDRGNDFNYGMKLMSDSCPF